MEEFYMPWYLQYAYYGTYSTHDNKEPLQARKKSTAIPEARKAWGEAKKLHLKLNVRIGHPRAVYSVDLERK